MCDPLVSSVSRDRALAGSRPTAWLAWGALLFLIAFPWQSFAATTGNLDPVESASALTEGAGLLRAGSFGRAAAAAAMAVQAHGEAGEPGRQLTALLLLAEAQQGLGDYQSAADALQQAMVLAQDLGDDRRLAACLGALGNVHIALGPPSEAERYLRQAAALADKAQAGALRAVILNNLGNHHAFQGNHDEARLAYAQSVAISKQVGNSALAGRSLANAARLSLQTQSPRQTSSLVEEALRHGQALPNDHDKAYLLINLARTLSELDERGPGLDSAPRLRAHALLREALAISDELEDTRAASHAYGGLGKLYEQARRYEEALTLTRRAIFEGQQRAEDPFLYRWYWQMGRVLTAIGERRKATEAYRHAVDRLQAQRFQMEVTYGPSGSSFREAVGPVYLQLVELLLAAAGESGDPAREEQLLRETRHTVELLKAAELRDYFRDECVDVLREKTARLEDVATSAAVVYPIVLDDRLELLLSLPVGQIRRYSVAVDANTLRSETQTFRRLLEKRTTNEYRPHARALYRWLIEPFESELPALGVDTLVFVPDGPLRTIPMSALYDGDRFLIEKYAVAVTPGLELTDPRPLSRLRRGALFGGLSESVQGFPPLRYVADELVAAREIYGGTILLDHQFVREHLRATLRDPRLNVLHIATHGEFKADVKESFLLAYDGPLTLDQLADYVGLFKFRETPLELLVLSACETARGDERAALGLSGIAVKAGARSAVGALWKVNDIATSKLMRELYRQLADPEVSRAVALQRAQHGLIDDLAHRHPGYWSAFLLLNSWI